MLYVERRNTESRLAAVAMYVRVHLDERLMLDGLGAIAGFSPFHFHRVFRVAFGENLNAYVVRHRMMRAANELRYSVRSVTDIALGCGYDSPSAFGRAFSRAFGASASAYRVADGTPARIAPRDVPSAGTVPEPRLERFNATGALALRFDGPYDELEPTIRRLYSIARRRGFMPQASIRGLSYGSPDLREHASLRFEACVNDDSRSRCSGCDRGRITSDRDSGRPSRRLPSCRSVSSDHARLRFARCRLDPHGSNRASRRSFRQSIP